MFGGSGVGSVPGESQRITLAEAGMIGKEKDAATALQFPTSLDQVFESSLRIRDREHTEAVKSKTHLVNVLVRIRWSARPNSAPLLPSAVS